MKKFQVFIFLLCQILFIKAYKIPDPTQTVVKAMTDFIRVFYIANHIQFDFIIYGNATQHMKDVINEVTKEISNETVVNIKHIENITLWKHELSQSAIFFIEFKDIYYYLNEISVNMAERKRILKNPTPKNFKFLIYVENFELPSKKYKGNIYLPQDYRKRQDLVNYQFLMTKYENSIILTAYVIYSDKICGKFHSALINVFDGKTQKWKSKFKNFDHFSDFCSCMLSFYALYGFGPHWYTEDFKKYYKNLENFAIEIANDDLKVKGLTHELIQMTAKKFNFTIHYTIENFKSKKFSGMKNFMVNENLAILLHSFEMSRFRKNHLCSEPYMTTTYYYLVTENDFYTNYEKLLMPFDFTTWILLSITISLTFALLFGTLRSPQWFRTLIFGAGVNHPAFNALGMVFGISQIHLPREFINRFVLALFIWFWLIFRTCYQSMLFEFMTSDMRKPLPVSIDDLREMNYTILVDENFTYDNNKEIINGRKEPKILNVNYDEIFSMYNDSVNGRSNVKYAFLVNSMVHSFLNNSFQKSLPIMNNEKLSIMHGYIIQGNEIFLNRFNEILHQLIPSGIPKYLVDYGVWVLTRPYDVEIPDSRRILSMTDLEFGFVLWLASLLLPITCFFCEILPVKLEEIWLFVKFKLIQMSLRSLMERYHDGW